MSQFERLAYMDRLLQDSGRMTTKQISQYFEVSDRQVKRDIEYLRVRLNAPIEYEPHTRSYRYQGPFELLRFADERMLLFYIMVRSLAETPSLLPIVSQEVMQNLENSLGKDFRNIKDAIHYEVPVTESIDLKAFSLLCEALRGSQPIHFQYTKANGQTADRIADPLKLVNYVGKWYLIAYDHQKDDLRTYLFSRMGLLKLQPGACKWSQITHRDRAEWLQSYLGSGFGIYNGTLPFPVTIEFTGNPAATVARQTWHKDQHDEFSHFGTTTVLRRTLPVTSLPEILGRILSFGRWAKPIDPPELVGAWKNELIEMSKI